MHEEARPYVPFLQVYVVWHPRFDQGCTGLEIAERLYREFCRDPDKPMATALGVPMQFRTSADAGIAPAPIDCAAGQHTIVVFLVDHEMVRDVAYAAYASALVAGTDPARHLFLAFKWTQGDLPLGRMQQTVLAGTDSDSIATLRLTFAAAACRLLWNQPRADRQGVAVSLAPPRLFISHAKRDAEDKALEIKALVEMTPVDTFFDRVDIAAGYDFTEEIKNNIRQSAVLAWQSDEYASRPWCNIELLTAKQHQRPIVVVLGVKAGEERSFPYLGNVRTIVATETNSKEIIIAAVREYFRKLHADGHFEALAVAGLIPPAGFRLFRPPEPIDGALLERKSEKARRAANQSTDEPSEPATVMYPDPPLSATEIGMLGRLFPDLSFVTPSTVDGRPLTGLTVALSISESDDLSSFGMSRVHLQAAMIEMARHLLTRGAIIAYGGDLRARADYGFTRQLFEIVHAYRDLDRPPVANIRNYLAHHIAAELHGEEEATLLKLAAFVKPVHEPLSSRFGLRPGTPVPDDTPEHRYVRARSLTVMREAMTRETQAGIFIGGRVSGHQGKYPGILEEAALSLGRRPMFLIGAFGGCTHQIIRMLRDKVRPAEFSTGFQYSTSRKARWRDAQGASHEETVTPDQLADSYRVHTGQAFDDGPIDYEAIAGRFIAADIASLNNNLTDEENRELFDTVHLERIVALVIKGLRDVLPADGRGSLRDAAG